MMPPATRAQLRQALQLFDSQRDSAKWVGWEEDPAHRWAIRFEGRLYPAIPVIQWATGITIPIKTTGSALRRYLQAPDLVLEPLGHHVPLAVGGKKAESGTETGDGADRRSKPKRLPRVDPQPEPGRLYDPAALAGVIRRFQTHYPSFVNPRYLADERDYKVAAAQK